MKKSSIILNASIILALAGYNSGSVYAQGKITIDSTRKELVKLMSSKDPSDKQVLNGRLKKLTESNNERELILASQFYYNLKKTSASDSVVKLQLARFPLGLQARSEEQKKVFDAKTAAEMDKAYQAWIKKFPPEKFISGEIDERLPYDYARSAIASKYATERNTPKAVAFINLLEVDFWKGNAYSGLSNAFYKNGDLVNAEIYAKKAMDNAESYTDGKKGDSNAAKFSASGYSGLTSTYANILFEEKKYNEALKYTEISYKKATALNPRLNARYAQLLTALNRNKEAFDKLEEVVKAGKASPEVLADFKKTYVKVKGSDVGYEEYNAAIRKSVIENLKKKIAADIVKEKAPNFTLTDLRGNKVTLADLKGKVVVLDFWATWCAPCKASFPAMQMAANKYQDDPNVKFLFIHTWERSETPETDAKEYVESMKYSFQVLMDTKDKETKENKVVTSYKVFGIPAKFVIDGNGDIRFKLTGFDGSNEAAVDELSMMIDKAKSGV